MHSLLKHFNLLVYASMPYCTLDAVLHALTGQMFCDNDVPHTVAAKAFAACSILRTVAGYVGADTAESGFPARALAAD